MRRHLSLAVFVAAVLLVPSARAGDQQSEIIKAGGAATVGAVAGGGAFAVVGSGGLAIAGTALSIGAAPFVAAGALVGLAGYGIYRVASERGPQIPPVEKQQKKASASSAAQKASPPVQKP